MERQRENTRAPLETFWRQSFKTTSQYMPVWCHSTAVNRHIANNWLVDEIVQYFIVLQTQVRAWKNKMIYGLPQIKIFCHSCGDSPIFFTRDCVNPLVTNPYSGHPIYHYIYIYIIIIEWRHLGVTVSHTSANRLFIVQLAPSKHTSKLRITRLLWPNSERWVPSHNCVVRFYLQCNAYICTCIRYGDINTCIKRNKNW